MTTITLPHPKSFNPIAIWQRLWATSRLLTLSALLYSGLFLATLVLSVIDTRLVTGAPVWFKPMKFALSSVLYTSTLVWLLSFVEGRTRLVNWVASVTSFGLLVEIVLIVMQAGRGVRSHFNLTSPFDGAVFSIMGGFILVVWLMNLLAAFLLMRQPLPDAAFGWSLRLGLLVTAVGAVLGFAMTRPTPAQMSQLQSGAAPTFVGAHSVGVADGGPGLPFTGWSTEGGDVRVAHFVGLHALQILPLVGLAVNRYFGQRLNERRRLGLVWTAGLGYLGLVLLLLWQALRGQSLIAPDGLTLAVLAGLVGAMAVAWFGFANSK